MRKQEKQDVQRKKQAFQKLIRQNHIHHIFTSARQQLCKNSSEDHQLKAQILHLVDELPSSAVLLVQKLTDSFSTVSQLLINNIDNFCSKIIRPTLVDWCYLVHIVNRLLVNTADKKAIEGIVSHSLLPLLEGAQIFLSGKLNEAEQLSVMDGALNYCYRLGLFIRCINQLEQNALISILRRLWLKNWDKEQQYMLIRTMLNILSMNFDEDDIENMKPSERNDMELSKIMIITQVFYKDQQRIELAKLMARVTVLATEEEEDPDLQELYLRLLITITLYLNNECYYYPLLELHLLHIISSILCLRDHSVKASLLVFSIRLLNNVLVNDWKLTQEVLQSITLSKLVSLHENNEDRHEVQAQIIQFFINLLHFMNDDSYLVRDLVNLGVGRVILCAFELESEYMSEDKLSQAVSTLMIMYSQHPFAMKALFLAQDNSLKKAMDLHPHCAPQIEHLLEQVSCSRQPQPSV